MISRIWASLVRRSSRPSSACFPPSDSAATVDMDYYGAITGRWDLRSRDRVLIYGKAGWGWVRTRASFTELAGHFTLVSGLERKDIWMVRVGWRDRIRPERLVLAEA